MISINMDISYVTKKYGADKVALLALFVLALLVASIITASRSRVRLLGPIKLDCSGLSVSMPVGNGWMSEKQWTYKDNVFTLTSSFSSTGAGPSAGARCQFLLAPLDIVPHTQFEQKAAAIGANVVETDQIYKDALVIDWAHIEQQEILIDVFLAIVTLPNGRRLDIQVHQNIGDTDLARQVFDQIIESLSFQDNHRLSAGSEIVDEIKNTGISNFFENQNRQDFFLVKDVRNRALGFIMDVLVDSGATDEQNIQQAGLVYVRGRYGYERATFFQSDNTFDEFVWKSKRSTIRGISGVELLLEEGRNLAVRRSDGQPVEKNYKLNSAAIPYIFHEILLGQMLNSNYKEIIVDLIKADGTITPTLVSRVPRQASDSAGEEAEYVIDLKFLDGRGFSDHVFIDVNKRILKKILKRDKSLVIERTSKEQVIEQFPEKADSILNRKSLILEQN